MSCFGTSLIQLLPGITHVSHVWSFQSNWFWQSHHFKHSYWHGLLLSAYFCFSSIWTMAICYPKGTQFTPIWQCTCGTQVTPKWRPSDTQVNPSDTQLTPNWHPIDTQVTPNLHLIDTQVRPKWNPYDSQCRALQSHCGSTTFICVAVHCDQNHNNNIGSTCDSTPYASLLHWLW